MQWIKKTRPERSQMTYQPFNGMNPLYCDRGMKKIRGVGGRCFIKKPEQNEVHDCEDDSYLWPLDLNPTPQMIRWSFFFLTLFISSPHLSFMFFFLDPLLSSSSLLVQLFVSVDSPLPFFLRPFLSQVN